MNRQKWIIVSMALTIVVALAVWSTQARQATQKEKELAMQGSNFTISGPYAHKNLSVFLVHGADQLIGPPPLTLQEAMEGKTVVVHETGNVNELAIENLSAEEVYVQSGDIVKGGRQDRVLAVDLIVPAHSGRLPIAAFCVEHGRWSQRGGESSAAFSASTSSLNSKDLKIAAKSSRSQRLVWDNVTKAQEKLTGNLGAPVAAAESASSLQLTLENRRVKETTQDYLKQLAPLIEGKPDVIGYAFAINGRINSADIYSSGALFRKLWPKMLDASAVEAIAELLPEEMKDGKFHPVTAEAIALFLKDAESGAVEQKDVTPRVLAIKRETGRNLFFETRDRDRGSVWLHRNYLAK